MSAKHTPGPWYADERGRIRCAGGGEIADIRGWGWMQYKPNGEEMQDANMRLIAAAPELLDALQDLMFFDNGKPEFEAARTAIAKATGSAA